MPHSKTPGGAGASEKFLKQQAESNRSHFFFVQMPSFHANEYSEHGEGASNAGGHTEGKAPGEAPVRLNWPRTYPTRDHPKSIFIRPHLSIVTQLQKLSCRSFTVLSDRTLISTSCRWLLTPESQTLGLKKGRTSPERRGSSDPRWTPYLIARRIQGESEPQCGGMLEYSDISC